MRWAVAVAVAHLGAALRVPNQARPKPRVAAGALGVGENSAAEGWRFEGRFIFAPQLVRAPDAAAGGAAVVSLFGWTVGGVVALEYDASVCGAYRELVEMGALVAKRGRAGQWGSRLSVSTAEAARACADIWAVPAEAAAIAYEDAGEALRVSGGPGDYEITGWGRTRFAGASAVRSPALPVTWTPEIKALWAPIGLSPLAEDAADGLAVHDLRLSAKALALRTFADRRPADDARRPLGFCLAVDGIRIDIAPRGTGVL